MKKTIEISEDLYQKLEALGGRLFSVPEVIGRLVEEIDTPITSDAIGSQSQPDTGSNPKPSVRLLERTDRIEDRFPRSRGAVVRVNGEIIDAHSVSDLYEQTLQMLVDSGRIDEFRQFIPFKTSGKRFLIAEQPEHPSGKKFVSPVSYGGLHMEAHKSYQTAVSQLRNFLSKGRIDVQYVG